MNAIQLKAYLIDIALLLAFILVSSRVLINFRCFVSFFLKKQMNRLLQSQFY